MIQQILKALMYPREEDNYSNNKVKCCRKVRNGRLLFATVLSLFGNRLATLGQVARNVTLNRSPAI